MRGGRRGGLATRVSGGLFGSAGLCGRARSQLVSVSVSVSASMSMSTSWYAPVAMTASMTFSRVARDCLRERWLYTLGCSATMDAKKLSLDVSIARCSRPVLPCSHHNHKHKRKYPTTVSNAAPPDTQTRNEGREETRTKGPASTLSKIHAASSSRRSASTTDCARASGAAMTAASTLSTWCRRCSSAWM